LGGQTCNPPGRLQLYTSLFLLRLSIQPTSDSKPVPNRTSAPGSGTVSRAFPVIPAPEVQFVQVNSSRSVMEYGAVTAAVPFAVYAPNCVIGPLDVIGVVLTNNPFASSAQVEITRLRPEPVLLSPRFFDF
jgi:hypothetical protein